MPREIKKTPIHSLTTRGKLARADNSKDHKHSIFQPKDNYLSHLCKIYADRISPIPTLSTLWSE